MLRRVLAAGAAASGAAISAAPQPSQCRAAAPVSRAESALLSKGQEQHVASSSAHESKPEEEDREWVLAEVESGRVTFSFEEVQDTMQNMITACYSAAGQRGVVINEVSQDGGSDVESVASDTGSANASMEAAESMIMRRKDMEIQAADQFSMGVQALLRNPDIQRACLKAMRDDPVLSDILDMPYLDGLREVEVPFFPPAAAVVHEVQENEVEGRASPLMAFVDSLGGAFERAGQGMMEGVLRPLGRVFVAMGKKLRIPMRNVDDKNPAPCTKGFVTGAMIACACVVVMALVFKRVHGVRVRFA